MRLHLLIPVVAVLLSCGGGEEAVSSSAMAGGTLADEANREPVITSMTILPQAPGAGRSLSVSLKAYDPEGARALLEDAGYPDGVTVDLFTQEARAEPALAQSLAETAAAGGFTINLNILPSAQYWDIWTEVDLGITIWAHRPLGTMVPALAYTADDEGNPGAWNETRWVDDEFVDLLREAERTLDVEARREIMCQLEQIQMERGQASTYFGHLSCDLMQWMSDSSKQLNLHINIESVEAADPNVTPIESGIQERRVRAAQRDRRIVGESVNGHSVRPDDHVHAVEFKISLDGQCKDTGLAGQKPKFVGCELDDSTQRRSTCKPHHQ